MIIIQKEVKTKTNENILKQKGRITWVEIKERSKFPVVLIHREAEVFAIFRLSTYWSNFFSVLLTIFLGLCISAFTGNITGLGNNSARDAAIQMSRKLYVHRLTHERYPRLCAREIASTSRSLVCFLNPYFSRMFT